MRVAEGATAICRQIEASRGGNGWDARHHEN